MAEVEVCVLEASRLHLTKSKYNSQAGLNQDAWVQFLVTAFLISTCLPHNLKHVFTIKHDNQLTIGLLTQMITRTNWLPFAEILTKPAWSSTMRRHVTDHHSVTTKPVNGGEMHL